MNCRRERPFGLWQNIQSVPDKFAELALGYNINIITGSMPLVRDGHLYNIGYLCRRDGSIEQYEKLHVTPDEVKCWGLKKGAIDQSLLIRIAEKLVF